MAVQPSVRSYLGIAKEVTKGTAVAPTDYIPVLASKIKPVDVIDPLYDEGLRGSMVKNYAYIQGRTRSTFDLGGAAFPDTFPYILNGLLGDLATTGASAPYTHTISTRNATAVGADAQPVAYTLTDFYSANVRAYAGCQFHDLTLNFSAEGMLEYDAKATGYLSATASTPTPTFSTVLPQPVWIGTVSIGGSTISNMVEGSITVTRPVTPIYGISNTQSPFSVFVGPVDATGSLRFVMEADTELSRYLTNTQPAISLTWAQGAGASATQIKATLTKGAYVAAAIDRSKDFVEIVVDITGIANTTDAGATLGYSPIEWEIKNAKASY